MLRDEAIRAMEQAMASPRLIEAGAGRQPERNAEAALDGLLGWLRENLDRVLLVRWMADAPKWNTRDRWERDTAWMGPTNRLYARGGRELVAALELLEVVDE